jgi:hypothetical protein
VNGNLYSAKLQIEPAATFNGQCHMTQEDPKGLGNNKSGSEIRKEGFQKAPSLAIS